MLDVLHGRYFRARPAEERDVAFIAAILREADRLEVERFYHEPPAEILLRSFRDSLMSWTAIAPDGTPVAMWGVAENSLDPRYGIPWMMGTDLIMDSFGDFVWLSRRFDQVMSDAFHGLCNLVDAEYTGAIRWLAWLGYSKGDTVKSPKGYDFVLMYKDTQYVR